MAKILIVDDASFMRSSLKYILETVGHTIIGMAKTGNEAIRLYKDLKPDLVTLDILMKDMDGMTALKEIMKIDPNARIIMITAIGQEEKQKEAKKLGAIGYIRKPFKHIDIISNINEALKQK